MYEIFWVIEYNDEPLWFGYIVSLVALLDIRMDGDTNFWR